jgi:hypothetical protein
MRGGSWRRKGCLCSGRAGLASDTDALQFDDAIWLPGFAKRKRLCRGTLLSRKQYLVDVQKWGFHDARLEERVHMDSQDIAQWTKAIPKEEKAPGEPA